jgi:rare lipoprotein A
MFDPILDLASAHPIAPRSLQTHPAPQASRPALVVVLALAAVTLTSPSVRAANAPPPKALDVHVDRSGRPQTGLASFYGTGAAGKRTASGLRLDPRRLTAASMTLPLGATAKVVNRDNGKTAKVVITDRGPAVKNRILDVSPRAAIKLGMKPAGVSPVKVVPLQTPPPQPLTRTARRQIAQTVRRNG